MCLIELAENGIDDGGAAALCTLLDPGVGCCMALNHLHLRGNMIGDSGALRLLASAGRLPSLRWLDLGGNPVNDKAVWRLRGELLNEHKRLDRLLPCLQRLAWVQASQHRFATGGAGSISAAYLLSSDLFEMVGSMPPPSHTAWNGQSYPRSANVGLASAALNRHAMERRRDPSGGMLTLREFEEVYEAQGYELWQEAGARSTVAKGQRGESGSGGAERQRQLKWDAASVTAAPKKELLGAVQAVASGEAWLRERGLLGKLKPLLKKTSAAHLQASYLQLLVEGGAELEEEPEPELQPEPEPEPVSGEGGVAGAGGTGADDGKPSLTREEVLALAEIGDIGVILSGVAVDGAAPVRGQLRRSQGRRNGKVLTGDGQVVWFAYADVESGSLSVARG